jgi:hypothetical protein
VIYPDQSVQRRRTIAIDSVSLLCLVVLAIIAITAHSEIAGLGQVGTGVADAGAAVSAGFSAAASALGDVPIVGGALKHALQSVGSSSGGAVTTAGQHAKADADRAAIVIAVLTFLVPALVLLQCYLPPRLRQIRQMNAIRHAFDPQTEDSYRRLIAQRAALTLPPEQVLQQTSDPYADLTVGNFDPLLRAAAGHAGVTVAPVRRQTMP